MPNDSLFANPFARAIGEGLSPPGYAARLGLLGLRVVVAILLAASATLPFVLVYGLFAEGIRGRDGWALSAGVAVVALTVVMGLGRRRPKA